MQRFELGTSGVFPEVTDGIPNGNTHRVNDAPAGERIPNIGVLPMLWFNDLQLVFESSIETGSAEFSEALSHLMWTVRDEFLASESLVMYPPTYQLFLNAVKQKLYDLADRGVLVRKFDGGWMLVS